MILGDILSYVCGKVGQTDDTFKAKIRTYAKLRRDMLWQLVLWKDTLSIYTKSVTADTHTLVMGAQVDRIVAAKTASQGLLPVDQTYLFNNDPQIWERSGDPLFFSQPPASALAVAPASAGEKLNLVSNNAADTGNVSIYGENAGEEVSETVTLNGTSSVQTVNTYTEVLNLSKEATAGTITVTGATSAATLLTLLAAQREKRHARLRLHETPGAADTLLVLAKRHAPPMATDTDTTGMPSLDNAILAYTMADALESMRQYGKAKEKNSEGNALLAEAKKSEIYQDARRVTMTPADPLGEDGSEDY